LFTCGCDKGKFIGVIHFGNTTFNISSKEEFLMVRVAVNGFGRIGRMVFRSAHNDPEVEFVAINDLLDIDQLVYLLKYDTVNGRFPGTVEAADNGIVVNGKFIPVHAERNPADLPWGELKVDVAMECTGLFLSDEKAQPHLDAGAKRVALSAPASGNVKTIVVGVNDDSLNADDRIVSNASCTTNCLAPLVKVLDDAYGLEHGLMTTIHAYTGGQAMVDGPSKKWASRRGRAGAANIVPTTTGAAKAVGKVLPHLNGKLDGMAMRVPIPVGSITDLVVTLKTETDAEAVNAVFKKAAEGNLKGVLEFCEDPIVSSDILGNPHPSIFDALSTKAFGKMVKVVSWYDNEWGYSCQLVKLAKKLKSL
jgi:glyceraldehyde 3-phosphate dehydrogenase